MKKLLLTMGMAALATSAFGQGYILFQNIDNSSCFGVCTNYGGYPDFAQGSDYTLALLWYNGTAFQQIALYQPARISVGNFVYPEAVTVPTYAATGTFIVQGWTGTNYSNYAAVVAAGGSVLVGETPAFTAPESADPPNPNYPPSSFEFPYYVDYGAGSTDPSSPYAYVNAQGLWTANLLLSSNAPPAISSQPVSVSTYVGSNVTLVVAPVYQNVTYQWQFDGTNIAGAMDNVLNLTNIQLTNAGYYDVVLSNPLGSVTSAEVVVSVGPPGAPSIYVNSNLAAITASAAISASISLVSGFTNGFVFYTLDGSTPTAGSTRYTSPFTLTNSATIQAIGYSSDFSQTATMQPLALVITPPYTITTSVSGNGSIGLNPNTGGYAGGSVVMLTATAGSNYVFEQWEGDISSTNNPLDVTVTSNLNVEAVFVPSAYPLTLDTGGGGTVTANGQSLTGPTYFSTNGVVTLTATPNSGWTFAGWQDGITSTNNPYYLQMTGPYGVEGIFQTVVQTSTGGGGQIVLNRTYPLPYGSTMTASAVPSNGNYFVLWSGLASGTNNPVVVTVTNTEISALFAALPANKLTLSVVVLSRGSVGINPQQSYYDYGDQVTLTASWNVASGYSFNGWSGAVNDTNSTTVVTVTTNMVVYANFSPVPQPTLAVGLGAQGPVLLVSELAGQYNEVIYCSTDLVSWQPIYTNAPVTGSFQYTDTNASNVPVRFYRVAVQ